MLAKIGVEEESCLESDKNVYDSSYDVATKIHNAKRKWKLIDNKVCSANNARQCLTNQKPLYFVYLSLHAY